MSARGSGPFPPGMLLRTITAAGYAAVLLGALWLGPAATAVVFGIMASLAVSELYAFTRREVRLPNEVIGMVAVAAMPLAGAIWGMTGIASVVTAMLVAMVVAHTQFLRIRTAESSLTVMGGVYVGFFISHFILIRSFADRPTTPYHDGLVLSLAVLGSVWLADILAYLVGSAIGRHKLAPRISPKKSWEGFIAGIVGSVALWLAVPVVAGPVITSGQAAILGLAIAVCALVGDLFESRLKREAGVKDSGNALPGHGGFLDRLDSIIFVSVVAYWLLHWMGIR